MNPEWWLNMGQLDSDQKQVMGLPTEGDYLVLGPPGSGKTNLLLLRANYLSRSVYPNLLVIVFGRALKEFLLRGSSQYRLDAAKISTSINWFYDVLRNLGEEIPNVQGGFDEVRTQLIERVRAAISKSGPRHLYDAILLDEAQDFLPSEIELFLQLGKRIFAVGDGNQKIYAGASGLDLLKQRCETRHLSHHYRNGIRICRFADSIASSLPEAATLTGESNYSEKFMRSSVEYIKCSSAAEQYDLIARSLDRQLKVYPGELLGVLCPRNADVNAAYETLSQSTIGSHLIRQSFESGYSTFGEGSRVCVTTFHSAKGLEFRAVHAPSIEQVRHFPRQRHLVFTMATRAKTSLSLYSVGGLPGYIESAMIAVNPPRPLPPLESAFGEELIE